MHNVFLCRCTAILFLTRKQKHESLLNKNMVTENKPYNE